MPTMKELEQLQKAKSTLKEILKVHMREPINDNEFQTLFGNMKRLRKKYLIKKAEQKVVDQKVVVQVAEVLEV